MCIERCKHGSEGGVGVFCSQMPHAYPTGDRLRAPVAPRLEPYDEGVSPGETSPK